MRHRTKKRIIRYSVSVVIGMLFGLWISHSEADSYTLKPAATLSRTPVTSPCEVGVQSEPVALPEILPAHYYDSTIVHAFHTRRLPQSIPSLFADRQPEQIEVAMRKGILPISDLRSAYRNRLPIAKVLDCEAFAIDTLKHSLPYLQPDALSVLKQIGTAFADSMVVRSGRRSRIVVTSLLRTEESIAKLRRRNRNAVENSAHQYARTFDISYRNFAADSPQYVMNAECQKALLAEVLYRMRSDSLIYVKHENHQGCFHITVR